MFNNFVGNSNQPAALGGYFPPTPGQRVNYIGPNGAKPPVGGKQTAEGFDRRNSGRNPRKNFDQTD